MRDPGPNRPTRRTIFWKLTRTPDPIRPTRRDPDPNRPTRRTFFWKLTRTPDPIQPTIRDPDPNRPTYGSKEGDYDLERFVRMGRGWSVVGHSQPDTSLHRVRDNYNLAVKCIIHIQNNFLQT